jgi:hypothetical protein
VKAKKGAQMMRHTSDRNTKERDGYAPVPYPSCDDDDEMGACSQRVMHCIQEDRTAWPSYSSSRRR